MYQILIADDERIERMVLHKVLQKYFGDSCEIHEAGNGREALAVFEEKQIQIAVLDIEMPGINGIEAATKMRELDDNCCIIFLTAFDEFNYAKKAIQIRAMEYILKPYEEEELLAVVEEALRITQKRMAGGVRTAEAGAKPLSAGSTENTVCQAETDGVRTGTQSAGEQRDAGERDEEGDGRLSVMARMMEEYIRLHYMEEISMQDAARMMNYSDAYFSKLFKQCFSCNFTVYLTRFRMEAAKKLLEQPTINIKEVGEAVGYSDSNYFAKVFRRYSGIGPTEYRAELLSGL